MSSLFMEAAESRELIRSLLALSRLTCRDEQGSQRDVEWLEPPEPYSGTQSYSAEDGGNKERNLRTYTVVGIRAWAGLFTASEGSPLQHEASFVGLLIPQSYKASTRQTTYRQVLEGFVASQAAPERGLALFDGAPPLRWGKISRRLTWERALSIAARAFAKGSKALGPLSNFTCSSPDPECAVEAIEGALKRPFVPRALMVLSREGVLDEIMTADQDVRSLPASERYTWITSIETFEKLYIYAKALKVIWSRGSFPVFIVKTSRSTSFCHADVPDVHVIEALLMARNEWDPGYVVANVHRNIYTYFGIEAPSRDVAVYPSFGGLRDFFENEVGVITVFARLVEGGYVFRIDVLFNKGSGANPSALAAEVISRLRALPLSSEGYPMPLVIADRNSRVSESDLNGVLGILGADLVPESRGVLRI